MTHRWGYPIVQTDSADLEVEATLEPSTEADIDQILANTITIGVNATHADEEATEVAKHFHCYERWLGKLAVPAGGKVAAEATLTPFQATSGNNTWGTGIQVVDTNDTPLQSGMVKFDPHRIMIVDASSTSVYRLRIAFGATYAAAITAGTYSGFMFRIAASSRFTPIDIKVPRHVNGTKTWVAVWNATNGATVDFFLGLHEYAS